MYIPVLHARQCERIAILRIKEKLAGAGNVLPLAIPVRDDKTGSGSGKRNARKMIQQFSRDKAPYFLLTTPYVQKVPYGQKDILAWRKELDTNKVSIPVVAVTKSKPLSLLEAEITALGTESFGVLHVQASDDESKLVTMCKKYGARIVWHFFYESDCEDTYCSLFKGPQRGLIRDGFTRRKNADHAGHEDELYSDLSFTYKASTFDGFGDHTICGELYTPGGFTPVAVAIHLTYPSKLGGTYDEVRIRHFVSDSVTDDVDEEDKFFEALEKLVTFVKKHSKDFAFSKGCKELQHLWTTHHYPKLGTIKRITIQHHVELMSHLDESFT